MARIPLIDSRSANLERSSLLDDARADTGTLPNLLKAPAHSPAALSAFCTLQRLAREGSLSLMARERIAPAIAQQTACDGGPSAHTAAGCKAGPNGSEMAANRAGTREDARVAIAVAFALKVSKRSGVISLAEPTELHQAGYSDADMLEIVTHVGLNPLAGLLAKAIDIEIDPPVASSKVSADHR